MDPVTGLATGRIAVGTVSVLSPALAGRMFLLDTRNDRQLSFVTRLFGSREVALGALTLAAGGARQRQLVQAGVAVDAADVLTGLVSAISGATSKKAGLLLAAAGAGALAVGVRALQD